MMSSSKITIQKQKTDTGLCMPCLFDRCVQLRVDLSLSRCVCCIIRRVRDIVNIICGLGCLYHVLHCIVRVRTDRSPHGLQSQTFASSTNCCKDERPLRMKKTAIISDDVVV